MVSNTNQPQIVLIVEDEPFFSRHIEALLNQQLSHEFQFRIVRTLSHALYNLDTEDIAVAICDLNLPDSTGVETAIALPKAQPTLPLVVLTGLDDHATGITALRAGAQDYIHKNDLKGVRLSDAITFAIERKKNELELAEHALRLSFQDDLTGLPTRGLLNQEWPRTLAHSQCGGTGLGLVMIDLDNFKTINDRAGHLAGDAVLREITMRLRKGLRKSDQIYQLGGDEFFIILEGISDSTDLERATEQIRSAFNDDVTSDEGTFTIEASLGVKWVSANALNEQTLRELFSRADNAMYQEKRTHRSGGHS